jgi:hypothetical protein
MPKTKHSDRSIKTSKTFVYATCVLLVFSVIAHVWCLNMLATKGYDLRSIEAKTADLLEEDKQLRIDEARLISLYRVEREMEHLSNAVSDDAEAVYATGRFALRDEASVLAP